MAAKQRLSLFYGLVPFFLVALVGLPARIFAEGGETPAGATDAVPPPKKSRPLYEISPLPAPDPRVQAAEGKIVSSITIAGNKHTKDYIITRELELAVGKPFHVATMEADICRLENLGLFSSIAIVPTSAAGDTTRVMGGAEIVDRNTFPHTYSIAAIDSVFDVSDVATSQEARSTVGAVDLGITVREMPWIIPYPAIKISDQTGLSVGVGAASGNLLGRDITLSGKVLFGGASAYQVKLDWPWITANHVSFNLLANHLVRDDAVRDFQERSNEIAPWFGTYLGEHGRLGAGFSYFTMRSDVDGITLSDDNHDILHRAGVALGYDTRDSWVNPHQGWDTELQVRQTGGFLGGDGDFVTTDIDVTRYQPAGRHTLVFNGLSSLQTGEVGTDVPSYLTYLMGGSNTVRGYKLKELGEELSGKNQLLGTIEYQYLLWDVREVLVYGFGITFGLELAAFVDNGTAWNTDNQFNMDHNRTGYGFGLRPLIPAMEELRLDFGFSNDGFVFHFATGPKMTAQRARLR